MHNFLFKCHECGHRTGLVDPDDVVTTSTGACPVCGDRNWNVFDDKGEVVI